MMVRTVTHSEQTGDVIGADRQGQLGQGAASVPYCTLKDTTPAQTAEQNADSSKQQCWCRPIKLNRTRQIGPSEQQGVSSWAVENLRISRRLGRKVSANDLCVNAGLDKDGKAE